MITPDHIWSPHITQRMTPYSLISHKLKLSQKKLVYSLLKGWRITALMDEKKYMLLIGADFVPEEGTTSCQDVPVARKLLSFYVQCDIGQLTFLVERVQSIQQSLLLRIQSSIILCHLFKNHCNTNQWLSHVKQCYWTNLLFRFQSWFNFPTPV